MENDTMLDPMETIEFKNNVIKKLPTFDLGWLQDDTRKKLEMTKLVSQASIMSSMLCNGMADFPITLLFSDMASDALRSAFLGAHLSKEAGDTGGVNPFDLVANACTSAVIIGVVVGAEAPDEVVEWANATLEGMAEGGEDYNKFSREVESLMSDGMEPDDEEPDDEE
jgi:hypothetical protein